MLRYKEREDLEFRLAALDDTVTRWRQRTSTVAPVLRREFQDRLLISLIYHDAALEGDVLSYSEIKASIDPTLITDSSLIPSYEHIKRYHQGCLFIREAAAGKKTAFTLDTLQALHAILAPEESAQGHSYRQENPLHRLYYHDIVAPEQIEAEIEALGRWLADPALDHAHIVERVVETHFRIMAIFPWVKQSGRCARLASNMILALAEFPMAVLHSIDRQDYYEALREEPAALLPLYIEAIETTAVSEMRVYEQARMDPRRQAS